MLTALLAMAGLALFLGLVLGFAAIKFKVEESPLVQKIDAILPQTQCGQCGFPGCKPYATAIAAGEEISTNARPVERRAFTSYRNYSASNPSRSMPNTV